MAEIDALERLVTDFSDRARLDLARRLERWPTDLSNSEGHEVVGALLARQVTLASQIASAPSTWNGHTAPLLLRAMADVHITAAWIFNDPTKRAKQYVLYGLGQQKLQLEHRRAHLSPDAPPEEKERLDALEAWISHPLRGIFDRLCSWVDDSTIEVRYSSAHVIEIAHVDPQSKRFARERARCLRRLTRGRCFRFWSELVEIECANLLHRRPVETGTIDNGDHWYPDTTEFVRTIRKTLVEQLEKSLPDGTTARVGFSLVFAARADWPEAAFFTCQQHAPEHFWKPDYQRHANTALNVTEVVMAAAEPAAHADWLARLTGAEAVPVTGGYAFTAADAKGTPSRVTLLSHAALLARLPEAQINGATPHFAGFRVRVADLAATERCFAQGRVPHRKAQGALVVPADYAFGCAIEFAAG